MTVTVTAVMVTGVVWRIGETNVTVTAVMVTGVVWRIGETNVTVTAVMVTVVVCWWVRCLAWRFTLC